MIRSMTGFGRGTVRRDGGAAQVEIRSLNHRYFEMACRLPESLLSAEDRVRELLQRRLRRGKVTVAVTCAGRPPGGLPATIDLELAGRYAAVIRRLQRRLHLDGTIRVEQLLALPQVVTTTNGAAADPSVQWPAVGAALEAALRALLRSKEAEGRAIAEDLGTRVRRIAQHVQQIQGRMPLVVQRYRRRLQELASQLSRGTVQLDRSRLELEVAMFARNCDVSEELTRLDAHIVAFRRLLHGRQREAGRQLDFIAQEMQREANTAGQKAQDVQISRWVIEVKGEIEKIREQVQNVE
jgi:uncharacterized protein (TIGR00255 family)